MVCRPKQCRLLLQERNFDPKPPFTPRDKRLQELFLALGTFCCFRDIDVVLEFKDRYCLERGEIGLRYGLVSEAT